VRYVVLITCALCVSCSYPEFGFGAADDSATPVETAIAETFEAPDVADTSDASEVVEDTCACSESERCVGGACRPYASCAALHAAVATLPSGVYTINPGSAPFATYCEMVEDGGGWTLVLKIDGAKTTFAYDSPLWTNDETLNPTSTAIDTVEAKLASFSTMPFTSLRLGMLDGTRRWIRLAVAGVSLRAVFSGPAITTTAGRAEWSKLLSNPKLQVYCSAEGLNRDFTSFTTYAARARLGVFGNNEMDCASPDSYLGFGAGFVMPHSCVGAEPGIVVGNYNPLSCGNTPGDERNITAFGYILLR